MRTRIGHFFVVAWAVCGMLLGSFVLFPWEALRSYPSMLVSIPFILMDAAQIYVVWVAFFGGDFDGEEKV